MKRNEARGENAKTVGRVTHTHTHTHTQVFINR